MDAWRLLYQSRRENASIIFWPFLDGCGDFDVAGGWHVAPSQL